MKEVTRIHIAKVTYDIELPAKKTLQHYIDTLANYANDTSVVEDIEIRITEILAERGVPAQGVITSKDVTSVKSQLGDPSEFISEGDMAIGPNDTNDEQPPRAARKLYRDLDTALLGGVLSGIGTYFSINATWIRLIFIALIFASFGFALFVYILLWIIVPAAKTTAQKLELRGVVVNAATIRQFGISEEEERIRASRLKRRKQFFGIVIGTLSILGALLFIGALAALTGATFGGDYTQHIPEYVNTPLLFSLGISCLVLPILFFAVLAYAGFSTKFTKRIGITLLALFLGTAAAGVAGVSSISYQAWANEQAVRTSIKHITTDMAKEFSQRTKLTIKNDSPMAIRYIEDERPRVEYSTLPSYKPSVTVTVQNDEVVVTYTNKKYLPYVEHAVTIYGPKLTSLSVTEGGVDAQVQVDTLAIQQKPKTHLTLEGSVTTLTAHLGRSAGFYASGADIASLALTGEGALEATFGTVRNASLSLPESCAADSVSSITFTKVINPEFQLNNQALSSSESHEKGCIVIAIGGHYLRQGFLSEGNEE